MIEVDLTKLPKPDNEMPSAAVFNKATRFFFDGAVQPADEPGVFTVKSTKRYTVTVIDSESGLMTCTCMSGQNKGSRVKCSHVLAVKMFLDQP